MMYPSRYSRVEPVNELASRRPPLLRGGVAATFNKMSRYLSQGAAREVRTSCNSGLTFPAVPNLGGVTFAGSARPPLLEGGELIFSRFFQFVHTFGAAKDSYATRESK
jgi:hypothetical protein